jgi:hypothetical protein
VDGAADLVAERVGVGRHAVRLEDRAGHGVDLVARDAGPHRRDGGVDGRHRGVEAVLHLGRRRRLAGPSHVVGAHDVGGVALDEHAHVDDDGVAGQERRVAGGAVAEARPSRS